MIPRATLSFHMGDTSRQGGRRAADREVNCLFDAAPGWADYVLSVPGLSQSCQPFSLSGRVIRRASTESQIY